MAGQGNADRVSLAFAKETVYGVIPTGNPDLQEVPFTGESISQSSNIVKSTTIRKDRQVPDLVRTNIDVTGSIDFELSWSNFDIWFESLLMSDATWSSIITSGSITIDFTNADSSINRTTGSFIADGFLVNDWLRVEGSLDNNGMYKIISVVALKMVVTATPPLTTAVGDTGVTLISGAKISNGTKFESYSIERFYEDVGGSGSYARYTGLGIDTMSLNVDPANIITGSFGFIGKKESSASATFGDSSNSPVVDGDMLNATDNVNAVLENNSIHSATEFSLSFNNNLRNRLEISKLGPVSLAKGKIKISGIMKFYFNSLATMDKYLEFNTTSLSIVIGILVNNIWTKTYIFDFPQIKFTDGKRVAGGENTDIIADMSFDAFLDPIENLTISITRFV